MALVQACTLLTHESADAKLINWVAQEEAEAITKNNILKGQYTVLLSQLDYIMSKVTRRACQEQVMTLNLKDNFGLHPRCHVEQLDGSIKLGARAGFIVSWTIQLLLIV